MSERIQSKDVWQATVAASSTRFRPFMLTATSTVLGYSNHPNGLLGADGDRGRTGAILTLVFLPTLYVAWFRGKEAFHQR